MRKTLATLAIAMITFGCATTPPPSSDTPDTVFYDVAAVTLTVHGLSCPLCANNLDGQLMRIDGITSAEIDLDTGAIAVQFAEGAAVTRSQISRAVTDAGFTLRDITIPEETEEEK